MKWFENIFTKSKLMLVSGVLGIIVFAALAVNNLFTEFYGTFPFYTLFAILTSLLLIAYKKGEVSCQKALSASLLSSIMVFLWCTGQFVSGRTGRAAAVVILENFMIIMVTIIFLNHILLQKDHKGERKLILISQIMLVIGIIAQFAEFILQIFKNGEYYDLMHCFALLCTLTMVTCMESKIQKYKAIRSEGMANGTWTEEERQKYKKMFKF